MKTRVLDSWAILEWINNRQRAAELVAALLQEAEAGRIRLLMSAINVGEVYYFLRKHHSQSLAESCSTLPVEIEVSTELACTRDGFVLTATLTRSANYHGAVRRNVLWWPQIRIAVVPLQSEIVFQAIWKMRLDNGQSLDSCSHASISGRTISNYRH